MIHTLETTPPLHRHATSSRAGTVTLFALLACLATQVLAASSAPATVKLQVREVALTYPTDGVVEAVRQATVAAQVAGRVVEVRADAGKAVKQGELLMRLDAREAAESVAGAQAQLAQARAAYERTKSLVAQKFMSPAALDQAEAAWKAAQAGAGASGASLSHANVTAPLSGIVAQRHTELGEMAAPGKPLVTVFDPKGLRVVASVPQYKLAEVRKHAKATVEFPETGQWIDAVRVEILPAADPRSHTVTARLSLPESLPGVIPGMAVRAHFVAGQGRKLTIPATAILRRGEVTATYVVDDKGQSRLRQIRLGEAVAGGEIEVLAGLAAGDTISLDPVKAGIELKQQAAPRR